MCFMMVWHHVWCGMVWLYFVVLWGGVCYLVVLCGILCVWYCTMGTLVYYVVVYHMVLESNTPSPIYCAEWINSKFLLKSRQAWPGAGSNELDQNQTGLPAWLGYELFQLFCPERGTWFLGALVPSSMKWTASLGCTVLSPHRSNQITCECFTKLQRHGHWSVSWISQVVHPALVPTCDFSMSLIP